MDPTRCSSKRRTYSIYLLAVPNGECASPSGGIAEEIGNRNCRAGFYRGSEDEITDCNVEHAEAERGKYAGPGAIRLNVLVENIDQCARHEISVSGGDLRQMQRCARLQTMIHIVHN